MENTLYDVLIIGGGPAGLSAAQYAARANLSTAVLDKSQTAGALAFTNKIENYPGLAPTTGPELLDIFRNQATGFGAEYIEAQVIGVKLDSEIKEVFTMGPVYKGKSVIIATGAMGRKPSMAGESEFLGKGVSYCAICDAAFYKNKIVCVIGDSEEAVKEAGLLSRFAETVYLIAPSKELKVNEYSHILDEKNIKTLLHHSVKEIAGDEIVETIKLLNKSSNKESELSIDGVFVYLHGSRPVVDFLNFAVDISDEECILINKMMETNIEGVFAAGDVACTEVRQVVIAASNGCIAALSAEKFINKRKKRRYDWAKSKD